MTATNRPDPRDFRKRLLAKEPLLGTFMKTPTSHNTEIIAGSGFDFVMLDEEHAPWDRGTLDMGLLAAKAFGAAGFVRIARPDANSVLSVLDDGAVGIMVPHVYSAQKARDVVSWAHYKGGTRGAGIGRAGEYGAIPNHFAYADETTTIMAMIEDRQAIEVIEDIVSVPGVDCIFLGRGDLGLSLSNAEGKAPTVKEAVEIVTTCCNKHNKPIAAVVQDATSDEAKWLIDLGITALMIASDHGFLRQAGLKAVGDFKKAYGKA